MHEFASPQRNTEMVFLSTDNPMQRSCKIFEMTSMVRALDEREYVVIIRDNF